MATNTDILTRGMEKINEANENEGRLLKLQAKHRVYDSLHCVKTGRGNPEDFCSSCQDDWEEVA